MITSLNTSLLAPSAAASCLASPEPRLGERIKQRRIIASPVCPGDATIVRLVRDVQPEVFAEGLDRPSADFPLSQSVAGRRRLDFLDMRPVIILEWKV